MKLNHYSKTVVGLVRRANEDNIGHIITPNKSNINLRIVCDGMGGHIGGAKASTIAVNSIKEYFSNTPNPVPQVALDEAINFANMQIFGFAQAEPEFNGMGTTCIVLLESEGLIYIAHVGDSRIYLHTDQKLYRITKDHSYVQGLVDKGEISDQQMETHPNKNQLTRALGIAAEVEVEVASKPILAKTGDSFLLCSDGLNGLINDRMINSVINTDASLETKCLNLITMAEAAGGHDNISVDLIEIRESKHITTQFVNKNNEDLIDTKTQQIIIDSPNKNQKIIGFLKTKLNIIVIAIGVLTVAFLAYNSLKNIQSPPELPPEPEEVVVAPKESNIIKVVVEKGWGKNRLNDEFIAKVNEKVGADNYCKDCPVYYKNGSDKPLSIHEYRKNVKTLGLGDFLMVTITDGKIDMPKINKEEKIEEKEPINQFSEETKKEKEEKERLEKERLEEERLENERQEAEKAELKAKEAEKESTQSDKSEEDENSKPKEQVTLEFGVEIGTKKRDHINETEKDIKKEPKEIQENETKLDQVNETESDSLK